MRDFVDTVKAFAREEEAVGVVEIILKIGRAHV